MVIVPEYVPAGTYAGMLILRSSETPYLPSIPPAEDLCTSVVAEFIGTYPAPIVPAVFGTDTAEFVPPASLATGADTRAEIFVALIVELPLEKFPTDIVT